jgi:hypothetical protein
MLREKIDGFIMFIFKSFGLEKMEGQIRYALIANLISFVGASKDAAEKYASKYVRSHPISAEQSVDDYVQVAVNRMASDASDRLQVLSAKLEGLILQYRTDFEEDPYLGLPISQLPLFDQITQITAQIECLKEAISSSNALPDEPEQQMSPQDPLPVFCTGSNHCSVAAILSLISYLCMGLGYTGNAPQRSLSDTLGDAFKGALGIRQDRCIVIEDIFKNLETFLQLLRENYPPYAPFLDRIFTLFSSKTFSKNTDGTCSPHEGSKEVLSYLKMLEESKESLGNRLQLALLSCGSQQCHSHLQMKPGVISAFGLPCASLDIDSTGNVRGLLPQIPFTVKSMAPFPLFGKTIGSDSQFELQANLFAAICDTRGRNQNFGAEDAKNAGTSHYYLVICVGDRYFFVDSSRTNVQEISQVDFLQNVNDNGIVIFMRNRVEQEVPQQVAKIDSQSPLLQTPSAGCGAVSRPQPPLKPSAGCATVSRPQPPQKTSAGCGAVSRPQPPLKPSAGCGAAADQHQTFSFGHAQSTRHPEKYDGSEISGLRYNGAFYDAITALIKKSASYPDSFLVNNLTLVWDDLQKACNNGVWVSGSFGFSDGPVKHLFRAVGFRFYDGTVVNHTGTAASLSDCETKTKFVERMNKKWRSSMITSILFAKCN